MPLKWRAFRVIAYLHTALAITLLASSTYWNMPVSDAEQLSNLVVTWVIFGILVANGIVNIVILERNYPDQKPGKWLNIFWFALLVPSMLIISFSILVTTGSYCEIRSGTITK